jgi:hypothetical protein
VEPRAFVIITAIALVPLGASAHGPKVGQNGGPQEDAGSFHLEIVPKGTVLQVYLKDHSDKAVSTNDFKGTAIFVINRKAERITLTPAGENQLKGTSSVDLPAEPKGAVQITIRQHGAGKIQMRADTYLFHTHRLISECRPPSAISFEQSVSA